MTMTKERRRELINRYINAVIDSMDTDDMEIFIADVIDGELQDYNDEQLVTHVADSYPHLLKD